MTKISARYVYWLAPFMSTEEVRYYLQGIYVEPSPKGGALLTATDGHVLAVVHDESAEVDKPFIWKPSKGLIVTGRDADKKEDVATTTLSGLAGEVIDGTFPDWRRVTRTPKDVAPASTLSLNPLLLRKFENVFRKGTGINIQPTGDSDPIIITSPSRPNFYGLLMPMRVGAPSAKLPSWMPVRAAKRQGVKKAA